MGSTAGSGAGTGWDCRQPVKAVAKTTKTITLFISNSKTIYTLYHVSPGFLPQVKRRRARGRVPPGGLGCAPRCLIRRDRPMIQIWPDPELVAIAIPPVASGGML